MREYMLLLRDEGIDLAAMNPELARGIMDKYQAWSEKLRADGRARAAKN